MKWDRLPQSFQGRRVFIIGGGPSVGDIPLDALHGQSVLACNASAFLLPFAPGWMVFGDKPFLKTFRTKLRELASIGTTIINATGRPVQKEDHWMLHVQRMNGSKNVGILMPDLKDDSPNWIYWNRSTGGTAINIACAMGAREIVLVGFDMQRNGKVHNWHDEYREHYEKGRVLVHPEPGIYRHFLHPFPRIAEDLGKLGISCWNTCRNSALEVFPYRPIEDLL